MGNFNHEFSVSVSRFPFPGKRNETKRNETKRNAFVRSGETHVGRGGVQTMGRESSNCHFFCEGSTQTHCEGGGASGPSVALTDADVRCVASRERTEPNRTEPNGRRNTRTADRARASIETSADRFIHSFVEDLSTVFISFHFIDWISRGVPSCWRKISSSRPRGRVE